jgi:hypothetical protein
MRKKDSNSRKFHEFLNATNVKFRELLVDVCAAIGMSSMPHCNLCFSSEEIPVVCTIASKINPSSIGRCSGKNVNMAVQMARGVDNVQTPVAVKVKGTREWTDSDPVCSG